MKRLQKTTHPAKAAGEFITAEPYPPAWQRGLGIAAVAMVAAFVLVLGVGTVTTEDLGYHLAYGEHFLSTGRIVDDGLGIYQTVPYNQLRYDLPPGAWLDAEGRYRFPNANWLSQVVMARVHRVGGMAGLSVLLAALSAGIFALLAAAMRRLGLGAIGIAAGMLLAAMASYERILLRPEVCSYLVLAAMLCLLVRPRLTRLSAAVLVVLQVLLVNLHSYFLLGLGLTGAFAAEDVLRRLWARWKGLAPPKGTGSGVSIPMYIGIGTEVPVPAVGTPKCSTPVGDVQRGQAPPRQTACRSGASPLRRAPLWVVLGLQVLACFANPWTWRLAILPIQTLAFMRAYNIAGGSFTEMGHPWAVIGEFFRPFASGISENSRASDAYVVLLVLAGAGALCAAWLRRWAHVLVILAMTAASLTMRRNIAPAAMLITPPALSACRDALGPLARLAWRSRPAIRLAAAATSAAGLILAGAVGVFGVLTQRFYSNESRPTRFALGISKTAMPLSAAGWINRNAPAGRLWTDYNTSSNLYWFTSPPHRDVPVLTNTWAYPPDAMDLVLAVSRGRADYRTVFDRLGVQIVTLKMDHTSMPLARRMLADANWALVDLDAVYATLLRTNGSNAGLARRQRITPETLDVDDFIRRLSAMDPVSSFPVYLGASTLAEIGWDKQAVAVMDHALANWPGAPHVERVWDMKGTCLAKLGLEAFLRFPPDVQAGRKHWQNARQCFIKALELRRGYAAAADHRRLIEEDIADEQRGRINVRPD